jgi:hypothetical protein
MLATFPSQLFTGYKGRSYRAHQPRIVDRISRSLATPDGDDEGYLWSTDFRNFGLSTAVSSNVGRYGDSQAGQFISYEDTGDAIAQIATYRQGAITFTTAATDNNESWLMPGGAASVMGLISDTAGDDKLLAFDCRFKIGVLAETGFAIGLSEEGLAAANTLVDDTGALASKDFIGFHCPMHASVATCSFVWRLAGQSMVTGISGLKTMVADTYYNMGFVYDPKEIPSKRIKIYLDNAEQTTYGTSTHISAGTFPDGEELSPLFGLKTGAASAKTLTIDSALFFQAG